MASESWEGGLTRNWPHDHLLPDSSLENCEKISFRGLKPPGLWYLAVAAWADEDNRHQQTGQNVKDFHFLEQKMVVGQPYVGGDEYASRF